jgi:hypothetical protein
MHQSPHLFRHKILSLKLLDILNLSYFTKISTFHHLSFYEKFSFFHLKVFKGISSTQLNDKINYTPISTKTFYVNKKSTFPANSLPKVRPGNRNPYRPVQLLEEKHDYERTTNVRIIQGKQKLAKQLP